MDSGAKMESGAEERPKKGLIYLYDGPPGLSPYGAQMVCFTSPNEAWFNYIKKSRFRPKVMMPLWDLNELQIAAEVLNLTMDEPLQRSGARGLTETMDASSHEDGPVMMTDLIERQYHIFGGVARACLSTDETFVKLRQLEIKNTIEKFESISYLQKVLDRTEAESTTHHSICHYVPNPAGLMGEYTIAEPTTFVKRLLVECLSKLLAEKRNKIIDYLRDSKEAASFRGTIFEAALHEKLNSGCTFTARRLSKNTSGSVVKFVCEKSFPTTSGEFYCYFDNNFTASVLQNGPYHVPSAKNFMSIDSFYYPRQNPEVGVLKCENSLWLFQFTVAQTHPVSGEGLAQLLNQLGLLEIVKTNPERAALIFVVPEEIAAEFGHQNIVLETSSDGDTVRKLGRIGDKRETSLNDVGVHTIGQLRELLKREEAKNTKDTDLLAASLSFRTLHKILSDHEKKKRWSKLKNVFDSIPQFVWGAALRSKHDATEEG